MTTATTTTMDRDAASTIARLQWITVVWMLVEVAVSAVAALRAHSVALLAFGGDSLIELLSAAAVLWRFRSRHEGSEKTASRVTAWLLFALAAFIVAGSVWAFVVPERRATPSYLGIGLLLAAGIVMPVLAKQKRLLAARTHSASLRADALQSSMCAYLAWIALAGLSANAIWGIAWADPVAALLLVPLVFREALESWRGDSCCC